MYVQRSLYMMLFILKLFLGQDISCCYWPKHWQVNVVTDRALSTQFLGKWISKLYLRCQQPLGTVSQFAGIVGNPQRSTGYVSHMLDGCLWVRERHCNGSCWSMSGTV